MSPTVETANGPRKGSTPGVRGRLPGRYAVSGFGPATSAGEKVRTGSDFPFTCAARAPR